MGKGMRFTDEFKHDAIAQVRHLRGGWFKMLEKMQLSRLPNSRRM